MNQVKIIGGKWRGRKLKFVEQPGLRPTGNRQRETLFNWIQFDIVGSRCLDLFAGSGALGLEALSRGAAHVTFVDSHAPCTKAIKESLLTFSVREEAELMTLDAVRYVEELVDAPAFNFIFLDPPFGVGLLKPVLNLLQHSKLLTTETLIYIEHESALSLEESGFEAIKRKETPTLTYGLWKQAG